MLKEMKIAVVGGGVSGLAAVHQISKNLPEVNIVGFEASDDIGGTWVYTDKTEVDEFGLPLATSMYKSLRTNLPKQVMEFSDFPIPPESKTFMENVEYLKYLQNYAATNGVKKYYKFRHLVTLIKPRGDKWIVTYKNLLNNKESSDIFNYVFICNGHYSQQVIPDYKNLELFKGKITHSHNYRVPDPFSNKNVLVVGSGPSGLDISIEIAKVAKKLVLSHHNPKVFKSPFPEHFVQRPDIREFTENSVVFEDDSTEVIDEIMFCTGYAYNCSFLSPECGIKMSRTHMGPLYRQVVNIEHPTMFFIGVPQLCCIIPLADMQTRYAVSLIKGDFKLPSKEDMLAHMKQEFERKEKNGFKLAEIAMHTLGPYECEYYLDMSKESGVPPVPPVFSALRYSTMETKSNLYTFRNYNYHIVDDYSYIRTYDKGTEDEWKTIYVINNCKEPSEKKNSTQLKPNFNVIMNDEASMKGV